MGTIIDITQYELNSVLANEEVESKIKLRRASHANLIEHVKNIPFKAVKGPVFNSSEFSLSGEQLNMNVSPKKYIQLVAGSDKPINVKEQKLENIKRHSDDLISVAVNNANIEMGENSMVISSEQDFIPSAIPVVEEQQEVIQPIVNEVSTNDVNDENNLDNIDDYISQIEIEENLLKTVKEQVVIAQQEADKSDEDVNATSIEFSELEKQAAERVKLNDDLDRQIMTAYKSQTRILALARKESEDLIEEANARKQANENKIVEMNSKMNDIRENITNINESIARKESILQAMQQSEYVDNIIQFSDMNDTEEKVIRIA